MPKLSKHTPGPWSADKWAPGYTVSAPNSHYSVCHLEGCNNAEANARLIAAAPDMLTELEHTARNLRSQIKFFPVDLAHSEKIELVILKAWLARTEAAIAKAGGIL